MNRTKPILLAATALAMFAAPQAVSAQTAPGAAVVFLPSGAPSGDTAAADINADGTVVVGSDSSSSTGNYYSLWRNGGVPINVGQSQLNFFYSYFNQIRSRVSGDGSTVLMQTLDDVGTSGNFVPELLRTGHLLWTPARGNYQLTPPTDVDRLAGRDLNSDGSIMAFDAISNQLPVGGAGQVSVGRTFRWSATGGFQELGQVLTTEADPFNYRRMTMSAEAISGDGNVIVGNWADQRENPAYFDANYNQLRPGSIVSLREGAFAWTATGGTARLPDLSASPRSGSLDSYSAAFGISRDGSTIVGRSRGSDGLVQATMWRGGVATGLGFIPGLTPTGTNWYDEYVTVALAVSGDGSVIVGINEYGANSEGRPWRWTAASGMQDLNVIAANAGLNLNGFVLADAVGISDNGQFITGTASNAAQSQSLGYVLTLAQITQTRLIVTIRLPGVTQTSIVNQTFNTQVDALLNGSTVFTRTVTDPITGAAGVTALADARASLQQTSGLRRVVIGAPVLISNTTTVLGTTNAVVDIASGTTTSTATVNAFGPTVVATGNLGTCATAAANNVNPTGCSLAGTPVTVDAGILNSNVFTNTLNTVTPTTTPTVNQLITAKWQVSATAGNQFGTVHALSGVAAFDRGDRLMGQLLGMGGGQSSGSDNHVVRAAMPMRDANGLVGGDSGLTMFGGYFGNWSHVDADASVPVASVKGNTNGFVLGLEKSLGAARVGVAVDHGTSDYTVRDATYPETLSLKHTQVALFAGWNSGGFNLDGAASYGFGTARTSLTTPTTPATGSRDVKSWSIGAQAGYTVPLGESASVALLGGVRHVSASLKAFTEVGGPSPLLGRDQTVTRTRAYAGIEAEAGIELGGVTLTPRVHARYAHDTGDASGTADLVFASAPNGPVMTAMGPGVGRDVAELGGSLDAQVSGSVHIWAGYDGTFRAGNRSHAAKAGVTINW